MLDDSKTFLFSAIVICHITFGIYWLYHFLKELRDTIRKKFTKFYLIVFLCFKKSKLEAENNFDQYKERIAPFYKKLNEVAICKINIQNHLSFRF